MGGGHGDRLGAGAKFGWRCTVALCTDVVVCSGSMLFQPCADQHFSIYFAIWVAWQ